MKRLSELRRRMGESEWLKYKELQASLRQAEYRSADNVTRWRQRVKMKLIQYKGGKCIVCGYDKPVPIAFEFHHRDPTQKDFTIGSGNTRAFEKLKKEADKCDLMCCRCHVEKHDEEYSIVRDKNIDKHEERIAQLKMLRRDMLQKYGMSVRGELTKCKSCNNNFSPFRDGQSTCSKECYSKLKIQNRKCKNRPSKEELQELINKLPWTQIGKMFSVTDNAVRKWARAYGILGGNSVAV